MKSDSVTRLWVNSIDGLILLEQGSVYQQGDIVVDLMCRDPDATGGKPTGEIRTYKRSEDGSTLLGKATLVGHIYPF